MKSKMGRWQKPNPTAVSLRPLLNPLGTHRRSNELKIKPQITRTTTKNVKVVNLMVNS